MHDEMADLYRRAQLAMAEFKAAVLAVVIGAGADGVTSAEVGRVLGIYSGHVGQEGHISRTLLAILQEEGVFVQDESSKIWTHRT